MKHFIKEASIVEHVDELPIPDFDLVVTFRPNSTAAAMYMTHSAMNLGHSPMEMGHESPAEMGHSPMEMGHESPAKKYDSPMNKESRELKDMPIVDIEKGDAKGDPSTKKGKNIGNAKQWK